MFDKYKHTVLNIFIASPGDVNPERIMLKDKIESINRIVRNIGWHIDLYGGEDTLPGTGRPQELINEDVDRCNLFIGILWKRWGQSTGVFSSGFEEEFDRATKRYLKTKTPEIWLFFKKVHSEELSDAGPQLARVLEFRERHEVSKQVFFKEFSTTEDYGNQIYEYLLKYIIISSKFYEISGNETPTRTASLPQMTEESPVNLAANESGNRSIPIQVLELAEAAARSIRNDKFELPSEVGGNSEQFNIARFYLIASTWLSQKYSTELLDAHCINILFKYRANVKLTSTEHNYIFRTIVGQNANNVPGWFWIKDIDPDKMRDMLFYYATSDNNMAVRINAIESLKLAKLRPMEEWFKNFNIFEILLADKSDEIKKATLSYLALLGDEADLKLLDGLLKDRESSIYNDALASRISIMLKIDANHAFSELLISPENLNKDDLIDNLENVKEKLNETLLINALNTSALNIRIFASNVLLNRNKLTMDLINQILKCQHYKLKEICYKELLRQGKKVNPEVIKEDLEKSYVTKHDLLADAYNQLTDQELSSKIDWYEVDGPIAYKILAKRDIENMKDEVRRDLNTQFEKLHETSIGQLKLKFGELANSVSDKLSVHDEFIRQRYIAAGLSVLAEYCEPQDIWIARKYINLDDIDIKISATKIISKYGSFSDIESLMELCKNSYGELKDLAANATLMISPGLNGAARLLISTNDATLIKFALKSICNQDIEQLKGIVEPMLKNQNENIRSIALHYLINKYSNDELQSLLDRYIDQTDYYYNVVFWLDRVIYAKPPLRDVFIKQLARF